LRIDCASFETPASPATLSMLVLPYPSRRKTRVAAVMSTSVRADSVPRRGRPTRGLVTEEFGSWFIKVK